MKESDKVVTRNKLGEEWLNSALISFEATKQLISYLNNMYGFDLYDNEENLDLIDLNNKQSIKEANVVLPLTYDMEKFLKGVIIFNALNDNSSNFDSIKEILNNIRKNSNVRGNLHNVLLLTDYISTYIDTNYINYFGKLYISRRNGYDGEAARSNLLTVTMPATERIEHATEEFKNAFIEFRYLYENDERIGSVDLIKLVDYIASIRDASLYIIKRKQALNIINKYSNNIDLDDFANSFAKLNDSKHENCDGIDLLKEVYDSSEKIFNRISSSIGLFLNKNKKDEFMIEKNIFLEDLSSFIDKLENEYKPEFSKKDTINKVYH